MPRKSHIKRLPADERAFVEQLLREDRLTLSEMIESIRKRFPDTPVSRSSLHRYQSSIAELTGRMREIDQAASAICGELGDGVGEKAGALLAQAVTTLATNAALRAQEDDELTIDEVRKLARAAKDAIDTRRISLAERQAIEKAAREKLIAEQKSKLDQVVRETGISADFADTLRKQILGIQ